MLLHYFLPYMSKNNFPLRAYKMSFVGVDKEKEREYERES